MMEIENFDNPILIEFVGNSEECSSSAMFHSWKYNAGALLLKAQLKLKSRPNILRGGTFSNAICLDKLLRERNCDSGQMSDAVVMSMFASFVFNHLRLNFNDISPNVVRRVVKKFIVDEKFSDIRFEAIGFLREVVEFVPPLFSETRLFWIDVFVDSSRVLCFNRGLELFGRTCMRIFCNQCIEYCETLLDILEMDYAGIHLQPPNRQVVSLPADAKKSLRVRIINSDHLDVTPLALLLICETNDKATHYTESSDHAWLRELARHFVENDNARWRVMLARVIGLLLDVNTFVFHRSFYSKLDDRSSSQWRFIPLKLRRAVETLQECIESPKAMAEFKAFCAQRTPFVCGVLKQISEK